MALLVVGTAIQLLLLIIFGIAMLRETSEPLYTKWLDDSEAAADPTTYLMYVPWFLLPRKLAGFPLYGIARLTYLIFRTQIHPIAKPVFLRPMLCLFFGCLYRNKPSAWLAVCGSIPSSSSSCFVRLHSTKLYFVCAVHCADGCGIG
ncbi:hypothetical protein PILCRDRAFT_810451 [Piloderma croceum F 1598]|uniref:Uncharacterized protein n=1 Tax=Piloderma croceum (strain F 1598) TaxID=765440 RepID=A0A0C3G835_PILCF|nr:hypothetical protein PILCRDRAFT_810451 [Piloderma croceum F 1598]